MGDKEGGSVNRSPILDDANYDYWKVRMTVFLKSIDSKTWKAIAKDWKHPTREQTERSSIATTEKPEEEWTKEEHEAALGNSKALNAIFNGVDKNMFRLINTCIDAKVAWDILKTAREGTTRVRMSGLQMLITQFENMRMTEEEKISEFHMRVRDLANSSFVLGEPMLDEKLMRKILRSLPKKFSMKVTAIEEAQDIGSMKVDELIGSLQTFELNFGDKTEKKNKSNAFVSNTDDIDCKSENLSEALALLGRKFNRVLRKIDRRTKFNVQDMKFDNSKSLTFSERPKRKINLKKIMVVTWSDEDTYEEDEVSANKVTPFSGMIDEHHTSDEDIIDEERDETYRLLHNK
ncbi:uncharacterized protein LOC130729849 [Lotus japonicus]|uniref:uncharacterized protein LOC130729849 n=1 Tax=Lotus japonicus TaxID=34305 RepID=UPI00258B6DAD|nr:uncharacterized protein LOC130729849 [Lotus japonicus]